MHIADSHDVISVRGARENNLKSVNLDIPKRRLTVFTGVSGSGKSSLVFDTIAAEARRMIDETYPAFVQGFIPTMNRPDVDSLAGITPAIIVDQERIGANARSTVGTATDANALLRVLFARAGKPHIGGPQSFSFNIASAYGTGALSVEKKGAKAEHREFHIQGGMCPECEGIGQVTDIALDQVIQASKSLNQGAILVPGYRVDGWMVRGYSESGLVDPDKAIQDYSQDEWHDLLYKEPTRIKMRGINSTYEGLIPRLRKSLLGKTPESMKPAMRAFVERAVVYAPCPACEGTRLNEAARSVRINGRNIAELSAMQINDLLAWLNDLDDPVLGPLTRLLEGFVRIGLGYLSLDRASSTLSGGEAQRVKLVRQLGSALSDVTYVFDEPSIGLHPHDIGTMNGLLAELRDKGNTVLVIEHKPEVIAAADHIVDMGPGAGQNGGEICFQGSLGQLRQANTLTGKYLGRRVQLKATTRQATGTIKIRNATRYNLQDVSVDIPTGVLCVVTGVAGSGKSTLIRDCMPEIVAATVVDQGVIKGSRRSTPATYTGLLEPIRKAFAKATGQPAALFSANSEGGCPVCKGAGTVDTELGFLEVITTPCEECLGRRFRAEVLNFRMAGRNIAEVMAMPVNEALDFFTAAKLRPATVILQRLSAVGLGYLAIGQQLSTLSGGERQRLKLATQMAGDSQVLVLDEPTIGLHLADIDQLLTLLDSLVDAGHSLIVIEHHMAVMAYADWVIDLGPGAGQDGGRVVFSGTPAELVADRSTLTGQHLGDYLLSGHQDSDK